MMKKITLSTVFVFCALVTFSQIDRSYYKNTKKKYAKMYAPISVAEATQQIEMNMFVAENLNFRAWAKNLAGDYEGAIKDCQEAFKYKTPYEEVYIHRGYAYACMGKYPLAVKDYERFAAAYPADTTVFNLIGNIKLSTKDYKGAIVDFDKAIRLQPTAPENYFDRGQASLKLRDYKKSIDDFSKVLEIDPEMAMGFNARGFAKKEKQDFTGAINDFDKALQLLEVLSQTKKNARYETGSITDVGTSNVKHLTEKLSEEEKKEQRYIAYNNRGNAKMGMGKYQDAISDFNIAIGIDPGLTYAFNNRAIAKHGLGDLPGSYDDFSEIIKLDPNDGEVYFNRAVIRHDLADLTGSIDDYNMALKFKPTDGQIFYNRALVKKELNNRHGACDDLNYAVINGFAPAKQMLSECK